MSWTIRDKVVAAWLLFLGLGILSNAQEQLVSDICLRCMCEALSGCNLTKACNGVACGLFHITYPYWSHGGKQTVAGESPESHTAYANCANDPTCAAATIQNYMTSFGRDCNGDNQIDCLDYAAIHQMGPYGCQTGASGPFASKLSQCLNSMG